MIVHCSVLFKNPVDGSELEEIRSSDFFADLNIDQIIGAITIGKEEYHLEPYFSTPLLNQDEIIYRQEVFRDLESEDLLHEINAFAEKMSLVRRYEKVVEKVPYLHHKEGWFLEAAYEYCQAVLALYNTFSQHSICAEGLLTFAAYLRDYCNSSKFQELMQNVNSLKAKLALIRYNVLIKERRVTVRKYEGEIDYSKEVEETFEKFKQGEVQKYRIESALSIGTNHVEAQILDGVARLFPGVFRELRLFVEKHHDFLDETIAVFDRQIQFYIAYCNYQEGIKSLGLSFCFPRLVGPNERLFALDAFDAALAHKRSVSSSLVVPNDFTLEPTERIIVVSGPNQGGKTTFARMFGQLHYLSSLGCPVPGKQAQLLLFDRIFTHFEREEQIQNLRGKLKDDLIRMRDILEQASSKSIIIMNEIFTSTALEDAIFLSKEIIQKIIDLGCYGVCVTFMDELSRMSPKTVSMVSTVDEDNPAVRTYKIIRKPADGLAHALWIAKKHHLSYSDILERIPS